MDRPSLPRPERKPSLAAPAEPPVRRSWWRRPWIVIGIATALCVAVVAIVLLSVDRSRRLPDLTVARRVMDPPYDRDEFGGWIQRDCLTTRARVLKRTSAGPVRVDDDCDVISGRWVDRWTGQRLNRASAIEIDHTVPLANAWRAGAWAWTDARRRAFANSLDEDHLVVMGGATNSTKADQGPEDWRPPKSAWCEYATTWARIKSDWNLSVTRAELRALEEMVETC